MKNDNCKLLMYAINQCKFETVQLNLLNLFFKRVKVVHA